ncbi:MAG: FHA domain-containing protein [Prevotella sp.]|nr:FHA domain-containing protein [Prevotella sp.]
MKRVRCPRCGHFLTFDETKYRAGQSLAFDCPGCSKHFRIRLKSPGPVKEELKEPETDEVAQPDYGSVVIIENVFHYQQEIPLRLGDNVLGRYMKGNEINCPVETTDPSIDMTHCVVNVSRNKHHQLKYVLRDGPSNTGTFVDNEILRDNERRIIGDGTIFTMGATSVILKGPKE